MAKTWFDTPVTNGLTTPYNELGALGQFGLILQNVADPTVLPKYNQTVQQEQQNQLILQQQQQQEQQRQMLAQYAQDPNFASLAPRDQLARIAAVTGDPTALAQYGIQDYRDSHLTAAEQANLGIQQAQLAISRQNAARQGRVDFQFIKGEDGSIYRANTQTGGLEKVQNGNALVKPPNTAGLPEGQMWGLSPEGQPQAIPIPGVTSQAALAKPTVESEKARRLGTAVLKDLDGLEQLAFDKEGDLNDTVVGQDYYGNGRTFNQSLRRAVQNTLYLKSGATAPPSEVDETLRNYAPNVLDSAEQARAKLTALREFAQDSIPPYAQNPLANYGAPKANGPKLPSSGELQAELARRGVK